MIKTDNVVVLSPGIKQVSHRIVAFLPFIYNKADGTAPDFQKTVTDNYLNTFETYFLKTGLDIVEREKVEALLKEQQFSMTGLTDNDRKKIGKLLSADAIVTGQINNYDMLPVSGNEETVNGFIYPKDQNRYNGYIALNLKAINVETSALLWKMNLSANISNMPANSYSEYYDRALKQLCEDAVNKFIKDYDKIK
ncbi:MAG: CsgG/HfaB family protein [Spirochaetes bacterium]|nr:CsgG/HfaB family protein [Spirochaetota bacterium]